MFFFNDADIQSLREIAADYPNGVILQEYKEVGIIEVQCYPPMILFEIDDRMKLAQANRRTLEAAYKIPCAESAER